MSASDLERIMEQYHRTVDAARQGDPEPQKRLWSRGDDATLANPIGPPVRGRDQIAAAIECATAQMREGEPCTFERISEYATADLAYIVEIERGRLKVGAADELAPVALRVTTIFRREDGGWRIVHRHADPITTPRPIESTVQQ